MRILVGRCVLVAGFCASISWAWSPSGSLVHSPRVLQREMPRIRRKAASTSTSSAAALSHANRLKQWQVPPNLPKLLVFDLDNTLWTPELYQIRRSRKQVPVAGHDIRLFDGVLEILQLLQQFQDVQLAVASRTNKADWARQLLLDFQIDDSSTSLQDILQYVEIYTGSKRRHFETLQQKSGMKFSDMLFFDDDVYLNLNEVSSMGVFCSHCPHGLTVDLFTASLEKYSELYQGDGHWMGHVVDAQKLGLAAPTSTLDEGRKTSGVVKFYNPAKRFGFVQELSDNNKADTQYFFHESKVAEGVVVEKGMQVEFETLVDGKGRPAAAILASSINNKNDKASPADMISMPCFSMMQPFVSLLLNGIKTVETRNNPMFQKVAPNTRVLLHCGRRDWRDLEAPKIQLRKAGYSDEEIAELSKLPNNMSKGSLVGVMTIGSTWESTEQERQSEELQRQVVASDKDMGKICTSISNAKWLTRPVRARGNPGVYVVQIPKDCLPDDNNKQ